LSNDDSKSVIGRSLEKAIELGHICFTETNKGETKGGQPLVLYVKRFEETKGKEEEAKGPDLSNLIPGAIFDERVGARDVY